MTLLDTEESLLFPLSFSEPKQSAILGHLISNDFFYIQAKDKIKPDWFVDIYSRRILLEKNKFYDEFSRTPTVEELRNAKAVLEEERSFKEKYIKAIDQAQMLMGRFGLDALSKELTEWMHSQVYKVAVVKSASLYNNKQTQEAYEVIEEAVNSIRDINFENDKEEKFINYAVDFERNENEYEHSLPFGLTLFERLLSPKAKSGCFLIGDMSLIIAPTNIGKCHGKDTEVIMYSGETKKVQDIIEGDELMGPDGNKRVVLSTTKGFGQLYEIQPKSGGDPWVCNEDHVLSLKSGRNEYNYKKEDICNISLKEYVNKTKNYKTLMRLWRSSLPFSKQDLPIDPYILGIWLGDGHSKSPAITNMDPVVINSWIEWSKVNNDEIVIWGEDRTAKIYSIKGGRTKSKSGKILESLGVINNKHIPMEYKLSSRKQRLELLAGIIDTDGYYSKDSNCFEVCTKLKILADDYAFLARSLGFKVTVSKKLKEIKKRKFKGWYYILIIRGASHLIPTRIKRKMATFDSKTKDPLLSGFRVKKLEKGDFYGFSLDGDHLYLLKDFTVTHNSTSMVTIACANVKAKKDVLFLIHEGRPAEIKEKIWCSYLNISPQKLMALYRTKEGQEILNNALHGLDRYMTFIPLERPGLTIEEVGTIIRKKNEERIQKYGKGYDLVIDDYPAKLDTIKNKGGMQRRHIDEYVYNYFTQLALDNKFHSLNAIQANREASKANKNEKEGRLITKEDVLESFGPVTTATNCWTINCNGSDKTNNRLIYFIDKSRNSATGYAVVCRSDMTHSVTHSDKLGATYYMGTGTYSDKLETLFDEFQGVEIDHHALAKVS